MTAKEENRCWPGYEPVPGKKPNSQGSCKPKAESKSTPSEKAFKAKRRKQLDQYQQEHPGRRKSSAQHLAAPDTRKKAAKKATKKPSKRTAAKRGAASKTRGAKKTASKRSS